MAAGLDQLLDTKTQLTTLLLGSAWPGDALLGEAPPPGPPPAVN
jgi:hypothetical protein